MFASACLMTQRAGLRVTGLRFARVAARLAPFRIDWWRTEQRQAHASAADIAWLCDASIDAFEATGDGSWLEGASELGRYLVDHYWDGTVPTSRAPNVGSGLFSQSDLVRDLPSRPKEIFDGATPSSHAVACRALARLGLCLADDDALCVAQRLVTLGASLLTRQPSAAPDLVEASGFALEGLEIVIPGNENELSEHVRLSYMVRSVLITGDGSPLLKDRHPGVAYVCRGGVCQLPVRTPNDLDELVRELSR
jgi:uncharacterized protein YyaL (SSP411 family)